VIKLSVETVKGRVSAEELGITLCHEHVLIDMADTYFKAPQDDSLKKYVDAPVTMEILTLLKKNKYFTKDNLRLDDRIVAVSELNEFKRMGGKTIIDLTLPGIGRDPIALREISKETGLNIVCGTGWYVGASHPHYVREKNVEQLAQIMMRDLTEGIDGTDIKAGVIGEIGCSHPLQSDEEKVLRAAARAQRETGAALTVHPGLYDFQNQRLVKSAYEYLDIMLKEDVDLRKVYMSHMSISVCDAEDWKPPLDYPKRLMDEYGITLGFDGFNHEYYAIFPSVFQSDRMMVVALVELCKQGYEKQIMLAQDVCMKIHLTKYGGNGYGHLLQNIVPELKFRGLTDKQIRCMFVENPARIFT
jgi:phosphotriesterase-related protein